MYTNAKANIMQQLYESIFSSSQLLPKCFCGLNLTTDWMWTLDSCVTVLDFVCSASTEPPPRDSSGVHTWDGVSFSQRNVVQAQRQLCWGLWKQYKSCVHGARILQIIFRDHMTNCCDIMLCKNLLCLQNESWLLQKKLIHLVKYV